MTRLLVSTTCRNTTLAETSGYLHDIDLKKGCVMSSCGIIETSYREFDPNTRGGLRGSKGIAVRDDQVLVSNFSVIFRYDPQWNLLGAISHPSCAGIHDVMFQDDTIWATSTHNDLLIQFDFFGRLINHFDMRQQTPALSSLKWNQPVRMSEKDIYYGRIDYRDPRTHEFENSCGGHVNSIFLLPDGDMLVSLGIIWGRINKLFRIKHRLVKLNIWPVLVSVNRFARYILKMKKPMHSDLIVQPATSRSGVVRIKPDGSLSLCCIVNEVSVPSHSLIPQADGTVVYLISSKGEVLHFDPQTGEILSTTKVTDVFLRGGVNISEKMVLLGCKNELVYFDLQERKVLDRMLITSNPKEYVYDIKTLPAHYDLLPETLPGPETPADKSPPLWEGKIDRSNEIDL